MAEFTAIAVQTVAPNANVLFTEMPIAPSKCIHHRDGSGLIGLRGLTNNQPRALFRISFGGNVAVPTGETVGAVTLAIALNGEALGSATMIATPAAVGEFFNVGADAIVSVPAGCCASVAVRNIGTTAVDVQNANIIVERIA